MAEERVQRRLAAIMTADVAGYSRLMGEDEEGTRAEFNKCLDEFVIPALEEHGGRLVKTMGDGFLVEFVSVLGAVQAAIDIQSSWAQQQQNMRETQRLNLRIGVHSGDVIVEGDDIHGDGVNISARLEGLAKPGGICISDIVHVGIRRKLAIEFEDLGDQTLKNIADPVQVFRVVLKPSDQTLGVTSEALFRRPAVAVLPFENMSGDPEQEYFSDGLTEDIITALSLWRSFPVIARNSTFAYKGQSPDIRTVGKDLGARYVIEGSVRKAGNRIRVTAQLINAETGHHIWAERYDRNLADIFDLQDEITARVAATVVPELERAEHKSSTAKQPHNLDAWDCVQRGLAFLLEFTKESNAKAREMFERAIQIDPEYSQAHGGVSYAYMRDLIFGFEISSGTEIRTKCLEYGRRAVELDDRDAMAHVSLGIAYNLNARNDDAFVSFQQAYALNPSNAMVLNGMGVCRINQGRPDEGLPYIERAMQLNPQDPRVYVYFAFMAKAHFTARRYDAAIEMARKAVQRLPDFPDPHMILAASLAHLGDMDEAHKEYKTADRLQPGFANPSGWVHTYSNESDNEHYMDGLRKAGWEG